MITLADMRPVVSRKSGRRYFRGRLADGSAVWLIEDRDGPGWTLKLDPASRPRATIDGIALKVPSPASPTLLTGQGEGESNL
jgi:hypothetical protein